MKLLSISDLDDCPKTLIGEVTLLPRIEAFLEDMNVTPMSMKSEFNMGNLGRRDNIFHASSIGSLSGKSLCKTYTMGCGRELFYSYTGAPSKGNWEPRMRRVLDTGTAIHAQLQTYLEEIAAQSDGTETFIPEAVISPRDNEIADIMDISGHTDGIYTINDGKNHIRFGLEIKSINDNGYKGTKGPHAEHKIQGTIYQKCLDLPVMLFLYYSKNDSNIAEYTHVFDPNMWKAIEEKLNFVRMEAISGSEPPQEVSWACGRCKYRTTCKPPKARKGAKLEVTSKFNSRKR